MKTADQLYTDFGVELESTSSGDIYELFRRWVSHPEMLSSDPSFRSNILNELTWCLSEVETSGAAWTLIVELAEEWSHREDLKVSLVISTFELFAEPPESSETLELLYSLAGDPGTRWAVFASYENYPWRLRPHAEKYSGVLISSADCDRWLEDQGLGEDEILNPNKIS